MAQARRRLKASPVTKEVLHELINQLPAGDLKTAQRFLEYLRRSRDPVLRAVLDAQIDDEPETKEDRLAVAEAKAEYKAGQATPHKEVNRRS